MIVKYADDRKQIFVSVLCITYNQVKYIAQTIESFLAQDLKAKFEIIIHDDASNDGTQEIIEKYRKAYPSIITVSIEEDNQYSKGDLTFMHWIYKNARGKYLVWCEGDDYWTDKSKLRKQIDFLESNPGYNLCFHPVRIHYEDNTKPDEVYPNIGKKNRFDVNELIRRNFIHTCSVMYRRKEYAEFPNRILPLDWYYHLYHAKGGKIGFITDVMAVYRRHPGGVWWESQGKMDQLMEAHGVEWLGLYVAMRKLFQTEPKRRKIIENSIVSHYHSLARVDHKLKTELVLEAAKSYPEAAELFIRSLFVDINNLQSHAKKQADIIRHYVELSERLQKERIHLESLPHIRVGRAIQRRIPARLSGRRRKRTENRS